MPGRHVRTHDIEEQDEATAASKEIVAVRAKRAEIAAALELVPEDLSEAVNALKKRDKKLHARMAELQDLFGDHLHEDVPDLEDGPPADRSLIPPL